MPNWSVIQDPLPLAGRPDNFVSARVLPGPHKAFFYPTEYEMQEE